MKRLLAHDVDGVFAANDMMGLGALRAIREAGHRVPDDIAVIGFDGIPFSGLFNPPLSTVSQPIMTLGEAATQTLIYLLDNTVPQAMYRILPVELVIRESTAKRVA